MSERPTVYLAGPMTGLTYRQAMGWRSKAFGALEPSWKTLSPIKGQIDFTEEMLDTKIDGIHDPTVFLPINLTASAYVTQDEFYVEQADFLLVNFIGSTRVSMGTIYEIGYGRALGKKIVTAMDKENVHNNGFIRRRSHVLVPTVEEAIEYLKHIAI